jgi:hypothetical protein
LPAVLDRVCAALNQGRLARGEEPLLSRAHVAWHCSCNANRFFQFGLRDEQLLCLS